MANFSSSSSGVTAAGTVLGISITDVTPPAAAAADSVAKSPLCVRPGSRKCTWVSITPGMRYRLSAAIRRVPGERLIEGSMRSIIPLRMNTSLWRIVPESTILAFFISMFSIFVISLALSCLSYGFGVQVARYLDRRVEKHHFRVCVALYMVLGVRQFAVYIGNIASVYVL